MDCSSTEALVKPFISGFLFVFLSACGEKTIVTHDVIGKFCARVPISAESGSLYYDLFLSKDGRYRYSISSSNAGTAALSMEGKYRIYGGSPVDRVELEGICLSAGRGSCGNYPAQVLSEWGRLGIVLEDGGGNALTLKKCS